MPSTATNRLQGLTTSVAVKAPCITVATSNITLSGLQTISSVAVAEDDRVLVVGQTTASENGIYVASTGSWTRALDFDGDLDAVSGTRVLVRSPNSSIAVEYELTTADPIVIGTTSLTFTLRYGANVTYDQTEAEIAAGVTPTNYQYPEGNVFRYIPPVQVTLIIARNTASQDGSLVSAGVQSALNIESGVIKYFPAGNYLIIAPLIMDTNENSLLFDDNATLYYDDTASPGSYCLTFGKTGATTSNLACRDLDITLRTPTACAIRILNARYAYFENTLINGYQPPSGLAADWEARTNVGVKIEGETGIDMFFNVFNVLHISHVPNGVFVPGGGISTQMVFYDFMFYGDSIYGDTDAIAMDIQGAAFSRVYGGYIEAIGAGGFGFRMLGPSVGGTTGASAWKVHDMVFDTVTTAISFASGTEENRFLGTTLAGAAISDSSAANSGNYVENYNVVDAVSASEANSTVKTRQYGVKHYTTAEEPFLGLYLASGSANSEVIYGGGLSSRNAATRHSWYTAANTTTTTGTERIRLTDTALVVGPNVKFGASTMGDTPAGNFEAAGTIFFSSIPASTSYADDAAAAVGGIGVGQMYRNGSVLQIRVS